MAGRIYTVAQQKGGAGKTTLAAHLAIAWSEAGLRVAVVDIDPQGSLTRWFQTRKDQLNGKTGIGHTQITGWRTQQAVERLTQENDVVVIDSPPHAEEKVPALLVINRVPPRAKLADDLIERITTMGTNSGATVARTQVGNRIQFAAALFEGRSVTESARRTRAAEEIQELAAEILNRG